MSLKVMLFKSLGAVSYSPSVVTMAVSVAVCDIFSVNVLYFVNTNQKSIS